MITWPDMMFPPINLWSAPKQKIVYDERMISLESCNTRDRLIFDIDKAYKACRKLSERYDA
jgi:hypothetical protein